MQDTAEGFGQPIRQIFEPFYRMQRVLPSPFDARPRYRVSTPRMSPRSHNVEFLAVVDTRGRTGDEGIARWIQSVRAAETITR